MNISSVFSLNPIQKCLTYYAITTYTIIGSVGLFINIAIFSQSTHRRKPCSLYILTMSLCALVGLYITVIPIIYEVDHSNSMTSSRFYCQITYYFRHAFNQMMRTFFIFACVDRYIICNNQARIRLFSQYKIAIRIIPLVILFWLLLSIYPAILRSFENGKCDTKNGLNAMMFSIYTAIIVGIIPLISLMLFCILLRINLQKIRRRIQPMINTKLIINQFLRKRDRDMLRMLLIEVICYTITTAPLTIMLIYRSATQTIIKNNERIMIESFLIYLTSIFLLYVNNGLSFWIYICASRSFRLEFKNLIIKYYVLIKGIYIE